MKKMSGKLEAIRPDHLKAVQGGVVPIVIGGCSFDYTPIGSSQR